MLTKPVNELTLGDLQELRKQIEEINEVGFNVPNINAQTSAYSDKPYLIGKPYIIRTVTMIYTGRLVEVYPHELVIEDAAWIPETARWADTLREGKFNEVEPYCDGDKVIIGRGAILDAVFWRKELPRTQK